MKIKSEFILREMAGQYIVVPVGKTAVDFNGMLTLNETAKYMWEQCTEDFTEETLMRAVAEEYGADEKTAAEAVKKFLGDLEEAGCLE